jgi:hypothetical protein
MVRSDLFIDGGGETCVAKRKITHTNCVGPISVTRQVKEK